MATSTSHVTSLKCKNAVMIAERIIRNLMIHTADIVSMGHATKEEITYFPLTLAWKSVTSSGLALPFGKAYL